MSVSNNYPIIDPSLLLDFANVKSLDPRITFTRSTTATYYDGVTTALAEQNLFLQSQDFDNASWIKAFSTVTANATTAPDGSATADLVVPNTTNNPHGLQLNVTTTGTTTISVYAKAGGYDRLVFSSNSNNYIYFNLTSGTVESTAGAGWSSPTITSVGGGWYRCVAVNSNSNTRYDILTYNALQSSGSVAPIFTGDGTSGVYLWGAQLEQRSSVTAYTATTTQAITNYIPVLLTAASGVPRFDHNPTTDESLGLLVEEQRTNLQIRSQEFDNAEWNAAGVVSVAANVAVAPDGTQTADKLITTSSVVGQFVGGLGISTATSAHTYTAYLKAGEYSWAILYVTGANVGVYFNLSNGTIGSTFVGAPTSSSITSVGNGWYRCSITFTATATTGCRIYVRTSDGQGSFAGNGFSGIYAWGAQLEAGSFATSYIPTVASTVTRNADAVSMTGTNFSSWYSAAEGTLYADFVITRTGSNDTSVAIIQGANTNDSIYIYAQPQSSRFRGDVFVAGAAQCALVYTAAGAPTSGTPYKTALAYKVNDFAMSINAATVSTDTSGTVPVVDRMAIGATAAVGVPLNGTIKKIAYYPLRVTNAQLQALTS